MQKLPNEKSFTVSNNYILKDTQVCKLDKDSHFIPLYYSEIVRSIIKDKKTFIEYIAFILGDDYVQSFLENRALSSYAGEWAVGNAMPAVYEKMLKASLSDPDRIGEIKYVTQIIEDREIIPDEFREMYQVFCETLGLK